MIPVPLLFIKNWYYLVRVIKKRKNQTTATGRNKISEKQFSPNFLFINEMNNLFAWEVGETNPDNQKI